MILTKLKLSDYIVVMRESLNMLLQKNIWDEVRYQLLEVEIDFLDRRVLFIAMGRL